MSRTDTSPGVRYGRWTVLADSMDRHVPCRCDCGTERLVKKSNLAHHSQSCGCLTRELSAVRASEQFRTHGYSRHPLYNTWFKMVDRCTNPSNRNWPDYGGRGIRVHEPWKATEVFIQEIEALLGPRPQGLTLERIDNDGGYEPGNVRWATRREQRTTGGHGGGTNTP